MNDHWDDMREKGFVSNRIFDALACGTCVISDDIEGLNDLFGDRVITYKTPSQLKELIDENLEKDNQYDVEFMSQHTYSNRVNQFINILK